MKSGVAAVFFLAVLLLLAANPYGQYTQPTGTASSCVNVNVAPYSVFNLVGYSLLGLIISVDVVAIGYIIGRIVPSTGIRNWIGEEFMEIAKTAMLIIGIFAVLTFMSNVSVVLALPSTAPTNVAGNVEALTTSACTYLNNIAGIGLPATLGYMTSLSFTIGAMTGLTVGAWTPIPIFPPEIVLWFESGFSYNPYVNPMFESVLTTGAQESTINDMFTYVIWPIGFLLLAQQALLPTLVGLGFVVLIPLGIAFRAFPFIRGIGGTLVAIGIGLSLIYPSVLVLVNGPVTNALSFGSYSSSGSANCGSNSGLCYVQNLNSGGDPNGAADALAALVNSNVYSVMNGMLFYSYYLILQFLLFITDIAIAFPLTDSIARSLGGTIRLQIGGKFKLA